MSFAHRRHPRLVPSLESIPHETVPAIPEFLNDSFRPWYPGVTKKDLLEAIPERDKCPDTEAQIVEVPFDNNQKSGCVWQLESTKVLDSTAWDPTEFAQREFLLKGMNNCYNFATCVVTHTFAQPGRATVAAYTHDIPDKAEDYIRMVKDGATSDGLKPHDSLEDAISACGENEHVVALLVAYDENLRNFHWVRREGGNPFGEGRWCQKDGGDMPTEFDFAGKKITDATMKEGTANWEDGHRFLYPLVVNGSQFDYPTAKNVKPSPYDLVCYFRVNRYEVKII